MRDIRISRLHSRIREERFEAGVSFPDFCISADGCRVAPVEAAAQLNRDGLLGVTGSLRKDTAKQLQNFVLNRHLPAVRHRLEVGEPKLDWLGDVHYTEDSEGDLNRWDLKLPLVTEVRAALRELFGVMDGLFSVSCGDLRNASPLCELSCMISLPGAAQQPMHADTPWLHGKAIFTVFCALHDIDLSMGPTIMYPMTHTDQSFHMGISSDHVPKHHIQCCLKSGDAVVMDSRLLHCGGANTSDKPRMLFYFSLNIAETGIPVGSTMTMLSSLQGKCFLGDWAKWAGELSPYDDVCRNDVAVDAALVEDVDNG